MRVKGQLLAAFAALEREVSQRPAAFAALSHAGVTTAVAWQFAQSQLAGELPAADYPALTALSACMEALPEFIKFPPDGPGVPPVA